MNGVEAGCSGEPENKIEILLIDQGHCTTAGPRQGKTVLLEQGMGYNLTC